MVGADGVCVLVELEMLALGFHAPGTRRDKEEGILCYSGGGQHTHGGDGGG